MFQEWWAITLRTRIDDYLQTPQGVEWLKSWIRTQVGRKRSTLSIPIAKWVGEKTVGKPETLNKWYWKRYDGTATDSVPRGHLSNEQLYGGSM